MIDDATRRQQTREIELELIRVRSAAEAARLESRAAELELLLRRMASGSDFDEIKVAFDGARHHVELASGTSTHKLDRREALPDSWSSRVSRLQSRDHNLSAPIQNISLPDLSHAIEPLRGQAFSPTVVTSPAHPDQQEPEQELEQQPWQRSDVGSDPVSRPHFGERTGAVIDEKVRAKVFEPALAIEHFDSPITTDVTSAKDHVLNRSSLPASSLTPKPERKSPPLPTIKAADNEDELLEPKQRFRPTSFLVSTLAHAVVLVLLGIATLATNQPKDQFAFTSSVAESSEETMETFAIESAEPMDETEPVPTETAYEMSTIGTMAATEVSLDLPPTPAPPPTSDLLSRASSSLSSSALKSLKSDTNLKSQFCGIDGGGSHFVYLVDSSGSMRDGFQSARTELLASIDQLKPDQRFYVVFFDEEPDYMRISSPNNDESASVMATPENKQRLRKWAMTVEMNKGKAPYDVLPFALKLRPDVIFLLSDGEFPAAIEDILRTQNRQDNLFGENGAISIVHTIRYHGVEGETGRKAEETMIKIAQENGGQYRHVPKPKNH